MIHALIPGYFRKQISEIETDRILRWFGLPLILIHFFTAIFWVHQGFGEIIRDSFASYCWPFFSSCDRAKDILAPIADGLMPFYFLIILIALWMSFKSPAKMWASLLVLEIVKLLFESLDYRFMGNYHFMPHLITLVFLFLPHKRFWIKIWLVSFYFAAATLKLNVEWLSGASMSWRVPFHSPVILRLAAVGALLTEVIAPQLLWFAHRWVRYVGLVLLVLFHIVSYYWVGFFYPAVMLSLLCFFYFDIRDPRPLKFEIKQPSFALGFFLWMFFILIQLNAMTHAQEFALNGEKRLLSLNMFDARVNCKGKFILHKSDRWVEVGFKNQELAVRVKCDPVVFMEQARHLCQNKDSMTSNIEAYLVARQSSDFTNTELVREEDVCRKIK